MAPPPERKAIHSRCGLRGATKIIRWYLDCINPINNLRRSWMEDAYTSWLSQLCWSTPSIAGLVTEPGSDAGSLSSGLEVNRSKNQNQAPTRHRPLEGASHLCQTHDCEGKPGDTSGAGLHPRSPNWYKNQGATSGQLLDHTRVKNRSET